MVVLHRRIGHWWWPLLGLLAAVALAQAAPEPPATQLYVQLIRGTPGDKPAAEPWKPVGPVLRARLHPIFRWSHYWEVRRDNVNLVKQKPLGLKLNPELALQVEWTGDKQREIRLYRNGELTRRHRDMLDSLAILGGDRESGESWFVVVRPDRPSE